MNVTAMTNRQLGRWGEDQAALHLRSLGWRILERNWRCRYGEIDIVALDPGGSLVICEVKTRRVTATGIPEEAVTAKKGARLRRLAGLWLATRCPAVAQVRVDVIAIDASPQQPVALRHVRNVA